MSVRLSVILVVYNMCREAPRSVQSCLAPYQRDMNNDDYEVIVVENGSSEALDGAAIEALGPNVRYIYLEDAPPSPARAINMAAQAARGEVLAVMIDGAHMLSPGVLRFGLRCFDSFANPVVVTLPFFLGPGPQMETVANGYDEVAEDALLEQINWPQDGYRLFEISTPYRIEPNGYRPPLLWLVRQFESNCLFMRRDAFHQVGGCDERFDLPGGGILLPDLYRQLGRLEDSSLVQLMGEASFHQVHGGTSTNVTVAEQKQKWQSYLRQYEAVRGEPYAVCKKPLHYFGHMPNEHARQLMITG
ncbi:glycosyltransferase family 2 protein [Pseudohalioglobus sediminis]|uniref:Glycosyltransferase family 2 protein n=1 Tax=Pseudohalioglobus sediminis TaxID=2606449 RepID=A0A5B0WUC4_9GAMM|nr:glycosyltransferase family A protein [Pseudohalioglobus sediminis]KAA1190068.1 glycosyltransferase family 2 protein [Pseudohalioglobus sediminis]